jgi:hypothetical protein
VGIAARAGTDSKLAIPYNQRNQHRETSTLKTSWIAFSLLSGLALSQVPSSTPKIKVGQLYSLHVSAWDQAPRSAVIRHNGAAIATKELNAFDPDLSMFWRASSSKPPEANLPLEIREVSDALATESSTDSNQPVLLEMNREYHALADERPFFGGKPEDGVHWYRILNRESKPVIAYLSIHVTDRELPSDIAVFVKTSDGSLQAYREGSMDYLPEATQTLPGLSSFQVRRLEPGQQYLIRVAANHPAYSLHLRSYAPERSPSQAVLMGMDFLVRLGDSWHANIPRRGAVADRSVLPHGEIQGCVACHPTVFTLRAHSQARQNGWPDVSPWARVRLEEQIQNHSRPLPGHPGVNWTRTIFSAKAISSRVAPWTSDLLGYLKLTGTSSWGEEADGAAPNVSPFEIALERYKALHEPEIAKQIQQEVPKNLIDLNWKLLGFVELSLPTGELVAQLWKQQRESGLFPYHFEPKAPGVEFITWHSLYALARAGVKLDDPRMKQLYELCLSRQKQTGEWQGATAVKAFDTPFRDTQFAVMALSVLVGPPAKVIDSNSRPSMPGKVGAIEAAARLRKDKKEESILMLLGSSSSTDRFTGVRVFWSHFKELSNQKMFLKPLLALAQDKNELIRFYAANALARWYNWHADEAETASQILSTLVQRIATESDLRVRNAFKQALYTAIDENEGYLATWTAQLEKQADRDLVLDGLAQRKQRIQLALAAGLSSTNDTARREILEAIWDHPQRHAGLPADMSERTEVVLPAYFTEFSRGVDVLSSAKYPPHLQNTGFRYDSKNAFYKTRVGNDSELPDLGVVASSLEAELIRCLRSADTALRSSALRALSVFPSGLSPKLNLEVARLLGGGQADEVRFVFENDARGRINLEASSGVEQPLNDALLQVLRAGNENGLRTILPALANVTPGEGLTRNPMLQGRLEQLLLHPQGVPTDLALAAAAVFPHIADGPLIRTTMLEAFESGDRNLETAAVDVFIKSYIAEPTNPVLGKQFAEKARGAMRRRMVDALDPARFSLRLSALNRYNPGRDVVLPEDANLFSSDVAQHLIRISLADQDQQVRRAAEELVWSYDELASFRGKTSKPIAETPDYEFFKLKIQPLLTNVGGDGRACVVCHATQGKFALRMPGKSGFTEAQSRFNYQSVLQEINLEKPKSSLLLIKPTRPNDNAGDPALHTSTHGGGTRWSKDSRQASSSAEYEAILGWIRGAKP